jgi:hypothetical protein
MPRAKNRRFGIQADQKGAIQPDFPIERAVLKKSQYTTTIRKQMLTSLARLALRWCCVAKGMPKRAIISGTRDKLIFDQNVTS